SIDKVLRTLPMDFYCGKKHRYRGIFCKFGESIAKFDEKWGIFKSPKPPKRVCRYAEQSRNGLLFIWMNETPPRGRSIATVRVLLRDATRSG
ncbi:MAG: hypothetical protein ABFC73_04685, partial [Clostridiaceae bacterium]